MSELSKRWRYYVPDFGESVHDAVTFDSTYEMDAEDAAAEAGEHIYHQRDGWENTWPIAVVMVAEDDTEHPFTVEREDVPTFHAFAPRSAAAADPNDGEG